MREKMKVLGSMLSLKEFTVDNLARDSGVNPVTVRTICDRNQHLLEEIGEEKSGGRGRRYKKYRLKPEGGSEIRRAFDDLAAQLPPVRRERGEGDFGLPLSLSVVEDSLLRLYPQANDLEQKKRLLGVAEFNLESGRDEVLLLSANGAFSGETENVAASLLERVETLRELAQAEYRVESGTSPDSDRARGETAGRFNFWEIRRRIVKVSEELERQGKYNLASAYSQRLLKSPLMAEREEIALPKKKGAIFNPYAELQMPASPHTFFPPAGQYAYASAGHAARPARGAAPRRKLLILPFTSPDPGAHLHYGVPRDISGHLSALTDLMVQAPTSWAPSQVSEERKWHNLLDDTHPQHGWAGAEAVLRGTARERSNKLHVTVQLLHLQHGRLWNNEYERPMEALFDVEKNILDVVSDKLGLDVAGESQDVIGRRTGFNVDAHLLYMKGQYSWSTWSPKGINRGLRFFEQALEKDLRYGLAYAGLADCYNMATYSLGDAPGKTFPKAKAAALEALELNNTLAEAHTSLAYSRLRYYWLDSAAECEFRRAIELNPNYTLARQWYAEYLAAKGRFDEAIGEISIAKDLDPFSPMVKTTMGSILFLARRYDDAIRQFQETLDIDSGFIRTSSRLGLAYAQKGMYGEAIGQLRRAVELSGKKSRESALLGYVYAAAGRHSEAREILDSLLSSDAYCSHYNIALVYTALKEPGQALDWLNKAVEHRDPWLVFVNVDPRLDPIREHAEFKRVSEAVGLAA